MLKIKIKQAKIGFIACTGIHMIVVTLIKLLQDLATFNFVCGCCIFFFFTKVRSALDFSDVQAAVPAHRSAHPTLFIFNQNYLIYFFNSNKIL